MTLLFIKRLNDTFEENAEKLIKEGGKSEKEAYENKTGITFSSLKKEDGWSFIKHQKILVKRLTMYAE